MSISLGLINTASVLDAGPRYRERPRIDLACGRIVGQTIHISAAIPAATALDLACRLARLLSQSVSVRIDGPLNTLPRLVAEALQRTGVAPGLLEIALSAPTLESAAIECLVALSTVRDMGVDVALHHFGAPGTLELVQYLPLSAVILKPSLLFDVPGSRSATSLLQALLRMARNHGLRVVATGIEAESQRALLSGLGCQQGEGRLFGTAVLQQDRGGPAIGSNLPKH